MPGDDPNPPAGPFSEAQLEAINAVVNKTVNGAINSIKKNYEQAITKSADSLKGDIAKLLDEKLSSHQPPPDDKDGKKGKERDNSVEMQTLRKEIAELRTAADESKRIASEERAKSRNMNLRTTSFEELAKVGVTGQHARLALNCLMAEQRIAFDTDVGAGELDQLVFRSDDEGWVQLSPGLKSWSKSADAKIFLPPAGAAGAGTRPGGTPPGAAPVKLTEDERKRLLGEYLDRALT